MRSAALLALAVLAASGGCSESHGNGDGGPAVADPGSRPVGQSCEVASLPPDGFDGREIYLETSSAFCRDEATTGACMVYQLDGTPSSADPDEVALRVFCTCRCSGEATDLCACPDDMTCVDDIVTTGGSGVIGGYCVKTAALGG